MTHEQYRERVELMYYDELEAKERKEIEAHMIECKECRSLHDELKKLHGVLAQYTPVEVTDRLLFEARDQLISAMRGKDARTSVLDRIRDFLGGTLMPNYKIALGGVLTIALGFSLGYVAFKPAAARSTSLPLPLQAVSQSPEFDKGEGQIANVRDIASDPKTGEVEFMFDAVMPVHMKGSVNDPKIQQVLAHAILSDENPGVRLRTVNALASERAERPDSEVRDILISAAVSDENSGVRMEALKALEQFPMDEKIKKTYLDVLKHDNNSAIRIAAINALASSKMGTAAPDKEFIDVLKQRMQTDNNDYIRLRAKAVLQENKQ
jgi:anti-sigma factor RsiW